jgi:hypothetical protein
VNFNSEITDERAPPVRRRAPRRACAAARHCCVAATRRASHVCLKAAVGTARRMSRQPCPRARPNSAPPRACRRRPDRLADRAVVPTFSPTAPPSRPKPLAHRRRAAVPALVSHSFLGRLPRAGPSAVSAEWHPV